ncbi:HAMP domain-containing histidine kinase [Alteromonas sediminis]|uniref:histidine kinase n=1 Tax=Alteromonas sediminis TaxID=2259342 RepID=A0A3N5YKB0_9ALTE|nr:ATP-binding protein [Alteromonas sediminis]RPJ65311.1 HAMP domain-containing histidine kinase [Alteromonas sediminis]
MATTSITLLLSSGYSLYSQIKHNEDKVRQKLTVLAKVMAANVAKDVANARPLSGAAEERLKSLEASSMITNAHIYFDNEDGSQSFFTSYNKSGQSTIPNKIGQLDGLYSGNEVSGGIELAHPIVFMGKKVGDLYMRASTDELSTFITESVAFHALLFILMLLIATFLALRLQRAITWPLTQAINLLHKTMKERNYAHRAGPSQIAEIDKLNNATNLLLQRIEEIIDKQKEAEAQHKKLNTSLEQMVSQRTVALKEANQELIQTLEKLHQFQRQIVQNEKMASLGDMVAGVAHEVNTPIGLGVTASTMMLDRLTTIKEQFDAKTLKASTMSRFIDEGQENLNIIYRNLNRAAELISSFKQVAVDQTSEASREVNVKQLINEILLSLRPRLKKTPHEVVVNCPDDLILETKAGPINQILINLIVNSIIHAFEDNEKGIITITISMLTEDNLRLIYTDTGSGIPNSIRKRIFDPFVTTKRGQGGSGLGMHLVYNLVTQGLNGSITLNSEEGQGVEFVIVFPVKKH